MMNNTMTCSECDELFAAWLEGDLTGQKHADVDAHIGSCARCQGLSRDIDGIREAAGSLGDLSPSRDLWKGIESRIQPAVVPIAPRRKSVWVQRAWMAAAASALIVVSSSVTYRVARDQDARKGTERRDDRKGTTRDDRKAPDSSRGESGDAVASDRAGAVSPRPSPAVASYGTQAEPQSVQRVQRAPVAQIRAASATSEAVSVDRELATEITALETLLDERRTQLDPATVKAVEDNLAIIDAAVAQAREALARDPSSGFLNQRLENSLNKKIQLLRTAALMRSST
jgi:hypothetical protein